MCSMKYCELITSIAEDESEQTFIGKGHKCHPYWQKYVYVIQDRLM